MPLGPKRTLTDKALMFVEEYLVDFNQTQAAIRAGYSKSTAMALGHSLIKKPAIAEEIRKRMIARMKRVEIEQDRVLVELARLAFFDVRKLFNADGSPKSLSELDDETAAVIAGLEVTEIYEGSGEDRRFVGHVKRYKLADKNAALVSAMRHLGMFNDRLKLDASDGLADRLARALEREKNGTGESP